MGWPSPPGSPCAPPPPGVASSRKLSISQSLDALLCFPPPLSRCTDLLSALRSTTAAVLEGEEGTAAQLGSRWAATSPGGGAECVSADELQLPVPLPLTRQQVGGKHLPAVGQNASAQVLPSLLSLSPVHSFSPDFCHHSPWISLFSWPNHSYGAHHKRLARFGR